MADQVEIDPAKMLAAAGLMTDLRQALLAVRTSLAATLPAGSPWGADSYGEKFADGAHGYLNSSASLLKGIDSMAKTFGDFAAAETTAANGMARTDGGSAGSFRH